MTARAEYLASAIATGVDFPAVGLDARLRARRADRLARAELARKAHATAEAGRLHYARILFEAGEAGRVA